MGGAANDHRQRTEIGEPDMDAAAAAGPPAPVEVVHARSAAYCSVLLLLLVYARLLPCMVSPVLLLPLLLLPRPLRRLDCADTRHRSNSPGN